MERFSMLRRPLQTEAINWRCTTHTRKSGNVNWRSVFENVVNRQSLKVSCCNRLGWGHGGLILSPKQFPYCKPRWGPWFPPSSDWQVWGNFVPFSMGGSSYLKVVCDYFFLFFFPYQYLLNFFWRIYQKKSVTVSHHNKASSLGCAEGPWLFYSLQLCKADEKCCQTNPPLPGAACLRGVSDFPRVRGYWNQPYAPADRELTI